VHAAIPESFDIKGSTRARLSGNRIEPAATDESGNPILILLVHPTSFHDRYSLIVKKGAPPGLKTPRGAPDEVPFDE
jgi:hypothetical protein